LNAAQAPQFTHSVTPLAGRCKKADGQFRSCARHRATAWRHMSESGLRPSIGYLTAAS
jgi:hypothetical protein